MSLKLYLFRCVPIYSCFAVFLLILTAFKVAPWNFYQSRPRYECRPFDSNCVEPLSPTQLLFVTYSFILHFQLLIFCPQLCIALWWINKNVKSVRRRNLLAEREAQIMSWQDMSASASSSSDDESNGAYALRDFVISMDEHLQSAEDRVIHAIIIPNYMEDMGTLKETLDVLASHRKAKSQYEIYLAMEAKEVGSPRKAEHLMVHFDKRFLSIKATFHPHGLPGESAGKSSNVAWAARQIFADHENAQDVIITVMDADTHFLDDYFFEIRRLHYHHVQTAHCTIYHCPIIFDRNANTSPVLVRTADLAWIWGSLAGLCPGSPISIPMSVYSLSMSLAKEVGGWDADSGAIGEDMHMLLKCFYSTNGRLVTRAVYSAASQCNVSGSESSALSGRWCCGVLKVDVSAMYARYKQGLRHLWGSLDSGYCLRRTIQARRILNLRHLTVLYYTFLAHFQISHFALVLAVPTILTLLLPEPSIHPALLEALATGGRMRFASLVLLNVAFFLHDALHFTCVTARLRDATAAGLVVTGGESKEGKFECEVRRWWHLRHLAERLAFPAVALFYGVLPCFAAQIAHLWTDELTYVVSKKPVVLSKEEDHGRNFKGKC